MTLKKLILCAILTSMFAMQNAYADWPVGRRKLMLYTSIAFYNAKNSWDSAGNYKTTNTSKFTSQILTVTAAYGLTRWLDLKVSLPIFETNNQTGSAASNFGYGNVTAGLDYTLINFNYNNFIGIYGGAVFPLYIDSYSKIKGLDYDAVEIGISNSGTLNKLFGYKTVGFGVNEPSNPSTTFGNAYYSIGGGYRYYLQHYGARQFSYNGLLGFAIDKQNQISAGVNGLIQHNYNPVFSKPVEQLHEFAYVQTTLSYGHKFTRRISAFISGFYTVDGRNTAQGYGASLQMVASL